MRLATAPQHVRVLRGVVVVACAVFVVSVIPGVRATPGYSQIWEVGFANVVQLGSAALVLLRAATARRRRLAWSMIGLGLGSYALGALYFSLFQQHLTEIPFPSVADGLWLAFYPGAFAGVLLLARHELQRRPAGGRAVTPLDGFMVGLTLAALSAAFAFDRITAGASGTPIAILTNFAYPVGDLVVLVLVVSVLAVLGRSADLGWWLLALGLLAFALADTWYLLQIAAERYTPGSPVDATWVVGQVLIGLAAWCRTSEREEPKDAGMSAVLVPALSGAAAVTVLVADAFTTVSALGVLLAAAAIVVVFVRLALALRQAPFLAESRLQARTDQLTGLPNRRAFYELLANDVVALAQAPGPTKTVLLLDLDQFKEVNDGLGHRTGDDLLRQVATRLTDALGEDQMVARLGGDEFALLVPGTPVAAQEVANKILAAVRAPYDLGVMTLQIDGSIGLAEMDPDAEPGRTLARADVAMYRAKSLRSGTHIYVDQVDGDRWDRLSMVEALRAGIRNGEMELDFQPLVGLATGRPCALEALVRWRHPQHGRVPPDEFLPMAEQTGLMHDVTKAVLGLALDHAVMLQDSGAGVPVAVNLSASDLLDATLADAIFEGLRRRGLPPQALQIEITETLVMDDKEQSRSLLQRLQSHGIRIAVDDYGTGYSSLAYLHDLPVNQLKIDRAFTGRLLGDARTATIVRSTIQLAHDLGLEVIAEGVETKSQHDWLQEAGADVAQGWYVARPMTAADSLSWLRKTLATKLAASSIRIVLEPDAGDKGAVDRAATL